MGKKENVSNEDLHRGLEERHIQMMAIGGAIGVGLFLGSAMAIKTAGPSILFCYASGIHKRASVTVKAHVPEFDKIANPITVVNDTNEM